MTHHLLDWESVLGREGYRVTRQRALILDAICAGDGHTSLGEIYRRVRRMDRRVDRSTVYRALKLFLDVGLVSSADTGDGETGYEIRSVLPHHHLVCRQCGVQQQINDAAVRALNDEIRRRHGFQIAPEHLVLFGTCSLCQADG